MERLGDLAHKVQHSEGKTRVEVVQPYETHAVAQLKTEMSNVIFRLGKEDTSVAESRQRVVDHEVEKISKVGRSVVLEEQRGGNERKRINTVRVDTQNRFDKPSISKYRSEESSCNNCRRKDRVIMDLKETLHEKDVFMMAVVEDAHLEQQEKTKLDEEIVLAKAAVTNLRKRLAQEVEEREADFRRHVEEMSRLNEKVRKAEAELEVALQEVSSLKKKLTSITRASRRGDALYKRLSRRISELQESQEENFSGMQRRDKVASDEIPGPTRKPAVRRRISFQGKRRSRNIVEERPQQIRDWEKKNQFDNSGKGGANGGYEKLQSAEIERMKSAYVQQIKELQNQVNNFQKTICDISQRANDEEQKLTHSGKCKDITIASLYKEVTERRELNNKRHLRDSETAMNRRQYSMPKDMLMQYMIKENDKEQELKKSKKLYMPAKVTMDLLRSDLHSNVNSSRILSQESSRAFPSSSSELIGDTQRVQNWLHIVKQQQAEEWEQRLSNERITLERQRRAKDERLEALRQQLLRMEKEATQNQEEIKMLQHKLRLASTKESQQS